MSPTGTVYQGINNIYVVRLVDGRDIRCLIKGKILQEEESQYNPLAPGDHVDIEEHEVGEGRILLRRKRSNRFARWNRKREAWQVLAANLDGLAVVISTESPPFRPRFVDRAILNARLGGVPPVVVINKADRGILPDVEERLRVWEQIGIPVWRISALTGVGMEELANSLAHRTVAFFGPSGVGKSTILNGLAPGYDLAVGEISRKTDRGRHITNFGRMIDVKGGGRLVDTPGVRELPIRGIEPAELSAWYPDIAPFTGGCSFSTCSHRHEPDCTVRGAVRGGAIHRDRYESYLRIRAELEEAMPW